MCEEEKQRALELVDMMLDAIQVIQHRTVYIRKSDDFLLTPDDMFILDGICMKLIFIGESVKSIDKLSKGELFLFYPSIPWREIMKYSSSLFQDRCRDCFFYDKRGLGTSV